MADYLPDEPQEPTHRDDVREAFLAFAEGFSQKQPHLAKVERYVDVLEPFALEDIKQAFKGLQREGALPAPGKIEERITTGLMMARLEEEARKRREILEMLADPAKRAKLREEVAKKAGKLVDAESVLAAFEERLWYAGLVGEDRAAKLVFLAFHTRHFGAPHRPVSIVVKGTSSAGKSFTVKVVVSFMAPGSIVEMSGMSAKYLAYASERGADFSHKFLFVHEACGIDAEVEKMLRVLLSEGCIIWRTVIDQAPAELVVEGPTGLVETTTELSVHWENETRLLSIHVDESEEQTRRVLDRMGGGHRSVDMSEWHALDQWIALGPRDAVVPFESVVAQLSNPVAPRVRRDLTTLVELVRAHALLHERHRTVDEHGRVVASLEDYTAVWELTADLFAKGVGLTVDVGVRKAVEAVAKIVAAKVEADAVAMVATTAEVAKALRTDTRSANRLISAALEEGFLDDMREKRERGVPNRVTVGNRRLPEPDENVFPSPSEVARALHVSPSPPVPTTPTCQLDTHGDEVGELDKLAANSWDTSTDDDFIF